jgi:ribosomal protein S18 acetylase RimI-like enzyme
MPVSIRDAGLADMADLQRVFERASRSNEHDRGLLAEHPGWLVLSDAGVIEGRTRVATDHHGAVVGFATVVIADGFAEIEDLFVEPTRMRQGIGSALVADLSARVLALHVDLLEVTANPHAMAFYEHLGFVEIRIVETPGYPASRMRRSTRWPDCVHRRGGWHGRRPPWCGRPDRRPPAGMLEP